LRLVAPRAGPAVGADLGRSFHLNLVDCLPNDESEAEPEVKSGTPWRDLFVGWSDRAGDATPLLSTLSRTDNHEAILKGTRWTS
jgi:hypothetical protein